MADTALPPRRPGVPFALSSALLTAALVVSFGLSVLYDLPEARDSSTRAFVLTQLRVPRFVVGVLVGSTLGLVGAAFQCLFRNPLATPSTLGTTAGATLGSLLGLALPFGGMLGFSLTALCAFGGALLTTAVVSALAASGRVRLEEVLLAGVAVSLAAGALSQALQALADAPRLFAAAQWALGQLPQIGYQKAWVLLVPTLLCASVLVLRSQAVAAISLGEDWAESMGHDVRRVRLEVLLLGSLAVGLTVALTGPIAFVGLIVPHLVRRLFEPRAAELLFLSWLAGAVFLTLCDTASRHLLPGQELPVGVMTAALGAPTLFYLVLRRR